MASPGTDSGERAVYAHHVRALLRRQQQDDRDAIGATLSRARFRVQGVTEQTGTGRKRRAKAPTNQRVVDFFTASPLTGRDRQTGGFPMSGARDRTNADHAGLYPAPVKRQS